MKKAPFRTDGKKWKYVVGDTVLVTGDENGWGHDIVGKTVDITGHDTDEHEDFGYGYFVDEPGGANERWAIHEDDVESAQAEPTNEEISYIHQTFGVETMTQSPQDLNFQAAYSEAHSAMQTLGSLPMHEPLKVLSMEDLQKAAWHLGLVITQLEIEMAARQNPVDTA